MTNLNQACGLNYGTCKHGRPLTQGCFECAQEKVIDERTPIYSQNDVEAFVQMATERLKQKERDFEIALTKIMDFTSGYDDIAGIVNRVARDALRDNAPSTGEPPHGLKETSPGRLGGGAPTHRLQYNKLTRKIDRVSLVTGLVADSFDPPEECYC